MRSRRIIGMILMWILGIIIAGIIISAVIIFFSGIIYAQDVLTEMQIPRPGIQGMVSNVAPGDLTPEQLFYSLNMDGYSTPGILKRRVGLQYYGTSNAGFWGVAGYYDPYRQHKVIVGVDDSTYAYTTLDTAASPDLYEAQSANVGQFFVSDTFSTLADNGVGGLVVPSRDAFHDWTPYNDMLIHCDGKAVPSVFTTINTGFYQDSLPDTVTYEPRVISLGLEAPGQLRVSVLDGDGELDGAYRYAYAFVKPEADSLSHMSLPSAPVYPNGESVALTGFENYLFPSDTADPYWKLILRQKQDGRNEWKVIDTLKSLFIDSVCKTVSVLIQTLRYNGSIPLGAVDKNYELTISVESDTGGVGGEETITSVVNYNTTGRSTVVYNIARILADSINAIDTAGIADTVRAYDQGAYITVIVAPKLTFTITESGGLGSDTMLVETVQEGIATPAPGTIIYVDNIHDTIAADAPKFDLTWIDTSIHAPGQLLYGAFTAAGATDATVADSGGYAYIDSVYNVAYSFYDPATGMESPLGPALHTTLSDSTDAAEDSIGFRQLSTGWPDAARPGWIRLYQGIVQSILIGGGDTTHWHLLYEMRTRDSARTIIWGNWTDAQVSTGLDTSLILTNVVYDYQVVSNISGDPIVLPPYNYDNQIVFSDIETWADRFWGIGDPQFPSRLYYSEIAKIWSWNPLASFPLDEGVNDELVALEVVGGQLVAFKHNSIWSFSGGDAEYNFQFDPLTRSTGAVSRETVIKHGDVVYFLSPELRVYVLSGGGLKEISQPIEDWIDSTFKASRLGAVTVADYLAAMNYAQMFILGDAVKLLNDSSGYMMSYHVPTGTWWREIYKSHTATYIPLGSFRYDSTENLAGLGSNDKLFNHSSGAFREEYPHKLLTDKAGTFAWEAEMSAGGDGINLYTVDQIVLNLYSRHYNYLRYNIYDETGDSLCTDNLALTSDSSGIYIWDVVPHAPCVYPRVKFWAKTGETYGAGGDPPAVPNLVEFEDIRFILRNHGRINAQ